MPIYEYKCHQCGQRFEVRRRITDEPLKTHKDCGGEVEQLISAPALHFKGTGWYVTDYAKGGKSPSTSGSNGHSDSKSESESQSESKAETKTESKTESKSEPSPATANGATTTGSGNRPVG
jgi:putative FmdB family regulatory protein